MDDDDFLYGDSSAPPASLDGSAAPLTSLTPVAPQPLHFESKDIEEPTGDFPFFAPLQPPSLPPRTDTDTAAVALPTVQSESPPITSAVQDGQISEEQTPIEDEAAGEAEAEGDEGDEDDEESEDDVEIIMEPASRSLDLRPNRPPGPRNNSATFAPQKGPSLTTEYTPRERNGLVKPTPISSSQLPSAAEPSSTTETVVDGGPDPSTLPPVTAPASHPPIDPSAPGVVDGRPVFEVDIANLADKGWRRPGADISDWFNYGFDEISWEAYCFRRREMGEAAAVLKTNVLNFTGMPEDQLTQLPPDVRAMVMASTNAMMNGGGGPQMMQGMMGPGDMGNMGMNLQNMQNMQEMQNMQMMNPMMVGMGNMGMDGAPPQGPDQGMGGDGFGQQTGMGGMGMSGEFGMQDPGAMQQGMFQNLEPPQAPTPAQAALPVQQGPVANQNQPPPQSQAQSMRGTVIPQNQFRGRGMMRGGRGFPGRGRGGPNIPPRAASPLPPNVPTGPRNQNRYKDRDNNTPAVEGLDYGGGERGSRTPTDAHEDRTARKRRERSPVDAERRDSKRR